MTSEARIINNELSRIADEAVDREGSLVFPHQSYYHILSEDLKVEVLRRAARNLENAPPSLGKTVLG